MSPTIHIRANRRRPCKLARHRMNIQYSPVHDLMQGERLSSDDNSHGTISYGMSSSLCLFLAYNLTFHLVKNAPSVTTRLWPLL
jgi:hypothetical protein